jgi:hypothetical protein
LPAFAVVLASIVASGAAIGMQVGAAVAIDEVILVGSAAAPPKTQVLLRLLHEWVSRAVSRSWQPSARWRGVPGGSWAGLF